MSIKKNVISLYVIQFGGYFPSLVVLPYLAHTLGPVKLGVIGYVQAIFGILAVISNFGFDYTSARKVSINRNNKEYIFNIYWYTLIAKSFISLILTSVILITLFYGEFLKNDAIILLLGCFLLWGGVLSLGWLFQGIERMPLVASITLFIKIVMMVCVFYFVKNEDDVDIAAALQYMSDFVVGIIITIYALFTGLVKLPKSLKFKEFFDNVTEASHIFFSSILTTSYTYVNAIILKILVGDAAVGLYVAAEKITTPLLKLFSPMIQAFFPKACRLHDAGNIAEVKKMIFRIIGIFLVASSIMFLATELFGHWFVINFFGSKFESTFDVLRIMIILPMIIGIALVLVQLGIIASGNQSVLAKVYFLGAIIHILQSPILVLNYGAVGSALSVVITESIMTLMLFFKVNAIFKRSNKN
jgi:PST family polysaccharide transporter